jgi:hypothetical protein
MPTATEFFRWWIIDERTGKRRLTRYAMTRDQAAERYPGAEPDLQTREVREVREPGEEQGNWRPPAAKAAESADPVNVPQRSSCDFCDGFGWVCADHPALPFEHDNCGAEGAPCVCNPRGAVLWKEIYAEARSDDEPRH